MGVRVSAIRVTFLPSWVHGSRKDKGLLGSVLWAPSCQWLDRVTVLVAWKGRAASL